MDRQEFIDAIATAGQTKDDAVDSLAHHMAAKLDDEGGAEAMAEWLVNGIPAPYGEMSAKELLTEAETNGFVDEEDLCETCGEQKKTFMKETPGSKDLVETYGCSDCDS